MIVQAAYQAEWDRCAPMLDAALQHACGTHWLGDVRQMVETDPDVWFWPGKRAAYVTQVIRHPRIRQLHLWLAAGDLRELLDMLPTIEARGIVEGCSLFTTGGDRPGWRRVLRKHGYEAQWEILAKDIAA